jgi:hypothetical protein
MTAENSMRIGDEDRERAAALLADHFTAGRLELDEFDERITRIYAARTEADLAPVFSDLPGAALVPHRFDRGGARSRNRVRTTTLVPFAVSILVAAMAWVALTDRPPFFLVPLAWVAVFRWSSWGRRTRGRQGGWPGTRVGPS